MIESRAVRYLLLAATLVGVTACSGNVRIGAVISETGAASIYGGPVKKGLDLALEEINAAGGYDGKPIELVYRDDQSRQEVGEEVFRELVEQQGVRLVIGAVSSPVTLAIAPIADETETILLSPTASSPAVTAAGDEVFRVYPSDILEGTAMAEFARDMGLERIVLFAVDNVWGAGLRDVFVEKYQSKFRQVVRSFDFEEGLPNGVEEMMAETAELGPDGIYVVGFVDDWAKITKAAREAGLGAVILGNSSYQDDFVTIAGEASENTIFPLPSFGIDSGDPATREFVDAYRAKYGETPDRFAAHGYDALKILVKAIEEGGTPHPKNVKVGLGGISNYNGASGKITFDNNGDIVQYPQVFIIRDGSPMPYPKFVEEGGSLEIPERG